MSKIHIITIAFSLFLFSCSSDTSNETKQDDKKNESITVKSDKQLNITILLDLSDRIDKMKFPCSPEHYQRDMEIINYFTELLKKNMENKGAFNANGKIKIIFSPTPNNPEINNIVSNLNVDLSKLDAKGKKKIFDNISNTFQTNIEAIYNKTRLKFKFELLKIFQGIFFQYF